PITREQILKIFEEATTQASYLIELYRIAFPEWDHIEEINGYPKAHSETCLFICQKCIEWDRKHEPRVMMGGAWLNKGFSCDDSVPPWFVRPCEVTYARGN